MRLYLPLLVITAHCVFVIAGEPSPDVRPDAFRVTKDDVCTLILEGQSLSRDGNVDRYAALLGSSNLDTQVHAAWALGKIQSPKAVEILLALRSNTTSEVLVHTACLSVYGQLLGCFLPGSEQADSQPKLVLESWAGLYHANGYSGLLWNIYRDADKTVEGRCLFFDAISEKYDPQLAPVLLRIYPEVREVEWKKRIRLGILNCSGFDVERLGVDEVAERMSEPDAFNPECILSRYLEFFRGMQFAGDDCEVLWKVVATTKDEVYRAMACRALRYMTSCEGKRNRSANP